MVDLKTLGEEELYKIWSDCCDNRWPDIVGRKPDGFDDLINEKRWHHIFAKRAKQDYLRPIGMAARGLISKEFFNAKLKEYGDKIEQEDYLCRSESEKIISLCYGTMCPLRWREKKAIREYCSKYPG